VLLDLESFFNFAFYHLLPVFFTSSFSAFHANVECRTGFLVSAGHSFAAVCAAPACALGCVHFLDMFSMYICTCVVKTFL
jgi:hypothetical protein